ncbi:MAG: hypothetical protein AAGM04_12080 [Pseudomonadota bacterium]
MGTLTGSTRRLSGTSVAAPQITRQLALGVTMQDLAKDDARIGEKGLREPTGAIPRKKPAPAVA